VTRQCVICGTPLPIGLNIDDLTDLGWRALQEGRGPRHYFCPNHSAKEAVAWFDENSKIGRTLRGEVPRRLEASPEHESKRGGTAIPVVLHDGGEPHRIVITYEYNPVYNGVSDPRTETRNFDAYCTHGTGEDRIKRLCQWALDWIAGQEEWCQNRRETQIVPGFYPTFRFLSATLDEQPASLQDLRRRAAGAWWW
jgi:hypothetical protein